MLFSVVFHHFHDNKNHYWSQGSSTSKELFKVIEVLKKKFNLINPDEFIYKVDKNKLKTEDVCLSFDDSLKAQFDIALPVLKNCDLKAFFFIYTGIFSKNPPLLEIFRNFRHSFNSINEYYTVFFGKIRTLSPKSLVQLKKNYPENYLNHSLFYSENDKKYRFLRDQILKEQYPEIVLQIMDEANYKINKKKKKIFMSKDDICCLSKNNHEVGLHSHSHPTTMANYSYSQQKHEYYQNKIEIEKIIGQDVISMSHPCGSYNQDTLRVLQEINIKIGFCKSLNNMKFKTNFEIPREASSNFIKRFL